MVLVVFLSLAGQQNQQVILPGRSLLPLQFIDPLPPLHMITAGAGEIVLNMDEFPSPVLPTGFVPATGTYTGTYVWGYRVAGQTATSYIGPVILATRGTPTQIKFVNNLGSGSTSNTMWKFWTDQTLHWAIDNYDASSNYTGLVPAVPHLHGGEVPPVLDGGPDSWFTNDDEIYGHGFYSMNSPTQGTPPPGWDGKSATYRYPNTQEAANIWFHDHALGLTRINVYAGLAGAYLLKDDALTLPAGLTAYGIGDETIIPLVIQDRMFDTNGQLFFPADTDGGVQWSVSPDHPFWVPEFLGDVIVVNGKAWPTVGTDPLLAGTPLQRKRYRFLFLNGSNARTYELFLTDPVTGIDGPPMWVIGTDGGYLQTPVKIDPNAAAGATKLVIMPGERYDVIIDFNDQAWAALNPAFSGTLVMRNTARAPYPKGGTADPRTVGRIVKFFVDTVAPATDTGYNPDPATGGGAPINTGIVRLVNANGTPVVTPDIIRLLTLNEVMVRPQIANLFGNPIAYPGGPLEALVNNTKWSGHSVAPEFGGGTGIRPDFITDPSGLSDPYFSYYSELPVEGETELWEIVNMTGDAHPIHLHLVQFQLLNRQNYNVNKYTKLYDSLFPGSSAIDPMTGAAHPPGVFIGGYGPPLDYNTGNPAKLGGNPEITPYLQRLAPPNPYEYGWKDTIVALPGQVTRIMVRWAPTDLPNTTPAANAWFPFDPNGGHGYVWHCHIIDHEDNEMMRPTSVMSNLLAPSPRDVTNY
jgi:FtsP/CotA-like multicopper oxidase with cupredoxin domain